MKVTNKLGLPEPFVNYANRDGHEPKENRYSVTELLNPIRQIVMTRRHYDDIEEDVSDSIPALLGTAVHSILEANTPLEADMYTEEPIESTFDGITLSGRIDLLDLKNLRIVDYKTCSTSKVMKEDFEDWRMQGLMYANLIFKEKGIIVKSLRFYAIMKDWSKIKAATGTNYPQSAVYVWDYAISDSDYDYVDAWVRARLHLIDIMAKSGNLPECTPEERWNTGDKWAVYKKESDKRAVCVCDKEEDDYAAIDEKCGGTGIVQHRPGEDLKCKYYCPCAKFCKKGGTE